MRRFRNFELYNMLFSFLSPCLLPEASDGQEHLNHGKNYTLIERIVNSFIPNP